MLILSSSNEKIKYINKLSRRSAREKNGEFIIEGRRSVIDAVGNGAEISYVLMPEGSTLENLSDVPVYFVEKKLFSELTDTENPQDMLAVAKMKCQDEEDIFKINPRLIVCCDRLQDPGNLGTIVRTADAVGKAAVVLSSGTVDLYNPKVIRSTMSSLFNVPVTKDVDMPAFLDKAKEEGYKVICGALTDEAVDLFSADFSGKSVIVVGNEGCGICDEVLEKADLIVKIPMNGKAESLNVSVSAGILMYEHLRSWK